MAKTISNLLVGIGFDLDKKSTDKVGSGIDSVKSKALKLGGVVAGAFGIKALTSDFASAKDDLGKFSQVFGSTANEIHSFGSALKLEGGTLEGFMSQLSNLEKFRAGLAIGDADFIAAAGKAGLDTKALIEAEDATEGYLALADQFQKMTKQQRINAAASLGLDDSSIRLLSKGSSRIKEIVKEQIKIRPITDSMTKSSAIYNDELQNLFNNIGGFADRISDKLLPNINNVIISTNQWLGANREFINSGIDATLDVIGDNIVAVGVALTALTAASSLGVTSKAISAIGSKSNIMGLSKVGGLLSGLGKGFVAVAAAQAAWEIGTGIGNKINEFLGDDTKKAIGGTITHALAFLGNDEAQAIIDQTKKSPMNNYGVTSGHNNPDIIDQTKKLPINNYGVTSGYSNPGIINNSIDQRDFSNSNKIIDKGYNKNNSNQPIIVKNIIQLDGQVIDKKVNKVLGQQASKAVSDLSSTEGG